jgi:hypothetical protein
MPRGCVGAIGFLTGALLAIVVGLIAVLIADSGPSIPAENGGRALGLMMIFIVTVPVAALILGVIGAILALRVTRRADDE